MADAIDADFDVIIVGGSKKNREQAERELETTSLVAGNNGRLNQKAFAALKKQLQTIPTGTPARVEPSSKEDGTLSGWLMHQGKMRGKWKKAFFVLKPPYLFQYGEEHHVHPKAAYYVAYAMSDRITEEELQDEVEDAAYFSKLEERACSLRLNVYTGNKIKVLTATSESVMDAWLTALDASVEQHTAASLLEGKREAATQIKPLLAAQLFHEVDLYRAMHQNLSSSGMLAAEVDPMQSRRKAKGGKLWLLKHGRDLSEEVGEEFLYFCIVDSYMYFYKEIVPIDDFFETDNAFFGQAGGALSGSGETYHQTELNADGFKWKGFINLRLAKVGMAPKEVLNDHRRANSVMLVTPLRTYVLVAMHELSAEDWMMQIQAAQAGTPLKERKAKMNLLDVYNDPVGDTIRDHPQDLTFDECLRHQVTNFYFSKFVEKKDASLGSSLLIYKEFAKLRRLTIQDLVAVKALKIRELQVKKSSWYSDEVRAQLDAELAKDDETIGIGSYRCIDEALRAASEGYFEAFKASPIFAEMQKATGPKYLEVTRADDKKFMERYPLGGELILGRGDPRDDGRQYVQLWRDGDDSRISREHCKLDVGGFVVLVTDLGSSNGTRYTPGAQGRIIKLDHLPPGGSLYLGEYVLTYRLGECKAVKKGLLSRLSVSRKK